MFCNFNSSFIKTSKINILFVDNILIKYHWMSTSNQSCIISNSAFFYICSIIIFIYDYNIVYLIHIYGSYIMKVTALIPDDIISDVQEYTKGKNITDSLIKALSDWLYIKRIQKLNSAVRNEPLKFIDGFNIEILRNTR